MKGFTAFCGLVAMLGGGCSALISVDNGVSGIDMHMAVFALLVFMFGLVAVVLSLAFSAIEVIDKLGKLSNLDHLSELYPIKVALEKMQQDHKPRE